MSDVNIELRAFSWDDLPVVVDLINRCEAVDQLGRGTSEPELRTWWTSPGIKPERHAFLAVADGDVIGYGRIHLRAGGEQTGFSMFQCMGRVLPSWRGQGVGTRILSECERRARARIAEAPTKTVYLEAYADKRQQDVAELYDAFGLKPVRYFFDMVYDAPETPPEPVYPPGYSARTFIRGQDEEATWRVMNTAFADHWGHVPFPLEEWLHWVDSPLFDPELTILGLGPGGDVVGVCVCTINPERNRRRGREEGWIDTLGVLREHRGKGLGRALLLEGMRRLRGRGCTHLVLGVDSENPTGALGLYESVGFRESKTGVAFRKVLRP